MTSLLVDAIVTVPGHPKHVYWWALSCKYRLPGHGRLIDDAFMTMRLHAPWWQLVGYVNLAGDQVVPPAGRGRRVKRAGDANTQALISLSVGHSACSR